MEVLVARSSPARWVPRFSTRGLIFLILVVALGLGWFASKQRADRLLRLREQELRYAEEELRRARDLLEDQMRGPSPDRSRSFWEAGLDGSNLSGMTIASRENAFQRASFRECRLDGATLEGGGSAFQSSRFDGAKLRRAQLKGGDASFQGSSFVGADLTGANLLGGSASFQRATFEGAILVGATLSGNFQVVNISGARFEDGDLSTIAADDLSSCYFKEPPTYNAGTKFPVGFDPVERSWRRVD